MCPTTFTLLIAVLCTTLVQAQNVNVVLFPFSPLVDLSTNYTGFSLDVWNGVMEIMNTSLGYTITPSYIFTSSITEFNAVLRNSGDLGISGIAVTPDQQSVFSSSTPYRSTVIRAFSSTGTQGAVIGEIWLVLKSPRFLQYLLLLFVYCIPASSLIWLLEHRHNPETFHKRYLLGLGAGYYWSWITLSTVGYGDKAPKTVKGQVFTIAFIVIGIVLMNLLTGAISAIITVNSLAPAPSTLLDLAGHNVTVITGSYAAGLAQQVDALVINSNSVDDAISLLNNGSAFAFLHEQAPLLRTNLTSSSFLFLGPDLGDVQYVFLYPPSQTLQPSFYADLNYAITQFKASSNYTSSLNSHFTYAFSLPHSNSTNLRDWIAVWVFLGVCLVYLFMVLLLACVTKRRHPEDTPKERNDGDEEEGKGDQKNDDANKDKNKDKEQDKDKDKNRGEPDSRISGVTQRPSRRPSS